MTFKYTLPTQPIQHTNFPLALALKSIIKDDRKTIRLIIAGSPPTWYQFSQYVVFDWKNYLSLLIIEECEKWKVKLTTKTHSHP